MKEKPYYTKRNRFVIVEKLNEFITDLPDSEKKKYSIIVSKIIIHTKSNPQEYCHIHSMYWKNMIGNEYNKYIQQLETWNIIKVNEYYHYKRVEDDPEDSVCKSYKLHSSVVNDKRIEWIFIKQANRIPPQKDYSVISDVPTEIIYKNLQRIGIKEHLHQQSCLEDDVEAEE